MTDTIVGPTTASAPPPSPPPVISAALATSPNLISRLDKLSSATSRRGPSQRALILGFTIICLVLISFYQSSSLVTSSAMLPNEGFSTAMRTVTVVVKPPENGKEFMTITRKAETAFGGSSREDHAMHDNLATEPDDTNIVDKEQVQALDGNEEQGEDQLESADDEIVDDFGVLDPMEEREATTDNSAISSEGIFTMPPIDQTSEFFIKFYKNRFLPPPQLDFLSKSGRQLKYQMHNCLKGRDGSKAGLLNAGIPRVLSQKSLENMPLHIIDPWASIMVACNAKLPMFNLARNPKVVGKRLISSAQGLLTKLCLGSMKTRQLECRRALSAQWGCSYETLGIQPAQYILDDPQQCLQLLEAGKIRDRSWLSKPSGGIRGRGIRYFANTAQLEKDLVNRGGCTKSNSTGIRGRLVQEYVAQPALIDGKYKFDVRTWLLIASVDPLIIFYHEGFARVAKIPYNERSGNKLIHITNAQGQYQRDRPSGSSSTGDDTDSSSKSSTESEDGKYMRSFDHVSEQLHRVHGLSRDFMQNSFRKQMMRATTYAALAQFSLKENYANDILTKKGFYQIYACDSMVDRLGNAHLLECNGFPAESQQQTVTGKELWGEMIALLLNLQLEPWRLMKDSTPPPGIRRNRYIRDGTWKTGPSNLENAESLKANAYAFGGWYLAFNELETPLASFNVCTL